MRQQPSAPVSYSQLLAALLLLVPAYHFNIFITVFTKIIASTGGRLELPDNISWELRIIQFVDFAYLPYSLFALLLFKGKDFKYRKVFNLIIILLPLYTLKYMLQNYQTHDLNEWTIPSIFYGCALLLYLFPKHWEGIAHRIITYLIPAGGISYGLYIIHFPLLFLISRLTFFSGTPLTWFIRLTCYVMLSVALAYWLERIYQPRVRKWLGW